MQQYYSAHFGQNRTISHWKTLNACAFYTEKYTVYALINIWNIAVTWPHYMFNSADTLLPNGPVLNWLKGRWTDGVRRENWTQMNETPARLTLNRMRVWFFEIPEESESRFISLTDASASVCVCVCVSQKLMIMRNREIIRKRKAVMNVFASVKPSHTF